MGLHNYPPSRDRAVLAIAAGLLACRLTLALAAIPPWQQPDEPTHIAHIEFQRSRVLSDPGPDPAREADILASMAAHDWWEHLAVGLRAPAVIPTSFSYFELELKRPAVQVAAIENPPAYYVVAGRAINWLPRLTVVQDMYLLRATSAILALLTLVVIWLASREVLGRFGGGVVTLALALHPQFTLISTAASPDATVNLLGACVWWLGAQTVTRSRIVLPLLGLWMAAILGMAADRMGVPLVAVALIVSTAAIAPRVSLRAYPRRVVAASAAVLGIVMLIAIVAAVRAFGETYQWGRLFLEGMAPVRGVISWRSFVRFTWLLHESWWYAPGWGRYTPALWWTAAATVLTVAAGAGLVKRSVSAVPVDRRTRVLLAVGAAGLTIQIAAVYWTYFRLGNIAQGRHLFPLMAPSLALLWTGLEAWMPPSRRVQGAIALLLLLALMDAATWMLVVLPAYYASL